MNNKVFKKIERFLIFFIVVLLAITITFLVIYSMNPKRLQDNIAVVYKKCVDISEDLKASLLEKVGGQSQQSVYDNLEFPDEEKLTEAQKYYYYQQLSETGKKIYLSIENNIEKIKNGEDNISLPHSLNEDAKSKENGKEYIAQEFQSAWDAFITDRSEYFYIDSSKVCLVSKITTKGSNANYEFFIGKGNNENYFIKEFKTKAEVDKALKRIDEQKKEILSNATGNNFEKIKYVHNWLVDNVKYDTTNGENASNIYGCLVNKNVVCEGYARTFKYLMDELQIPCVLVSGKATDEEGHSERHAWNYVYLKNNWFAIDTTWDDPIIIGKGKVDENIKYKYFLRGSKTMDKDHTINGQVTKNGFVFKYPTLSEEDIN